MARVPTTTNDYMRAIRDGIDFVDLQAALYTDTCTSFAENKRIIEMQKARVQRRAKSATARAKADVGESIVYTSYEDPSHPDIIHHNILRVKDYVDRNREGGGNEQLVCRAIVSFVYAYWEESLRYRLAEIQGVKKNEIVSDIFGDLRILRHAILHEKAQLPAADHNKLKVLKSFAPDDVLSFSGALMHQMFKLIKQDFARLLFEHMRLDSANIPVDVENIESLAIQFGR